MDPDYDLQWLLSQEEKQDIICLLTEVLKTNYEVLLPSPCPPKNTHRLNLIKPLNLNTNLQKIQDMKEH